jgi:organic hydroperoxide reductase OsmC/OhrA
MGALKDFRFRVSASPRPHGLVRLGSDGKAPLDVAAPPEFRGGVPDVWTPEDLLVASVASCYTVTLRAISSRREVPLQHVEVEGVGHVTRRAEGRFGFVVIELRVDLTVEAEVAEAAERVARAAKQRCLVAQALEIPVELELNVHQPNERGARDGSTDLLRTR